MPCPNVRDTLPSVLEADNSGPVTNKPFKRFIGIDLGGGKGKKTALAVLERSKVGVTVTALHPRPDEPPLYDTALIAAVRDRAAGAAVCVDAPADIAPCVRCQLAVCPGQESCADAEVVSLRRLLAPGPGESGVGRRGKPAVHALHPASD